MTSQDSKNNKNVILNKVKNLPKLKWEILRLHLRSDLIGLRMTTFLFVLLTFGFSLFTLSKAHAASPSQVIRVSPVIIHLDLSPNKTTTYTISVENLLSSPLPVNVSYNDFDTTEEDGGYILKSTPSSSLSSWVHLDKQELIIPAKTKQNVTLSIKTPQNISLGGYYGLLFFQPFLPQGNNQTLVEAQVGVLLLGDIGVGTGKEIPGEILSFHLPYLSQTATMPMLLRVKNTSLNFFTAKPILHIKPLFGAEQRQFLEEKIIFPGKVRRWEMPLTLEHKGIGLYTLTMQVSTGNGHTIQTSRFLVIFPWLPVVTILCFLIVLIWAITRRKKLRNALKAFFTQEPQK